MHATGATPASIDAYIAAQASAVQPMLQRIRAIVREEAPQAVQAISYRIPAFKQGGVLIYFAAFSKHIGVYPPVQGDAALLEALAPYRGPKGNLSFPFSEPLPLELIGRVAKALAAQYAKPPAGRN